MPSTVKEPIGRALPKDMSVSKKLRLPSRLSVLILLALTHAVQAATACHTSMPSNAKEHWAWRIIDGRQCWYAGETGRAKSELFWPVQVEHEPEPIPRQQLEPPQWLLPVEEGGETLPSVSPPSLPVAPSFKERWRDMLNDLALPFWLGKDSHERNRRAD